MKAKRNISIEISENELKEIVAKHVESKGYKVSSENVTFRVSRHLEGFGMTEHPVMSFDSCIVNVSE